MSGPRHLLPPGLFGALDVVERTRLTYRELHYAVTRGWLPTANGPDVGSGQRFLFDEHAVRVAVVFAALRRAGIAADVAGTVAAQVVDLRNVATLGPGIALVVEEHELEPAAAPTRFHR